uniref:Uncharacterized protein n=1 Tax=Schizaphis graminum TaxID=13262 RepID=A0A2S2P028_SCHGA
MRKLGSRIPLPESRELTIVSALFPTRSLISWTGEITSLHPAQQIELFNLGELVLMASRLPGGMTPGPDYVPNEIIMELPRAKPALLLNVFNKCLETGIFPARWKVARLVLLYKWNAKPLTESSSYNLSHCWMVLASCLSVSYCAG